MDVSRGVEPLRVILINNIIFNSFFLTLPVFLQQRLGANEREVGVFLTGVLLVGAAFQVVVLPWLLRVRANRTSAWLGFAGYIRVAGPPATFLETVFIMVKIFMVCLTVPCS